MQLTENMELIDPAQRPALAPRARLQMDAVRNEPVLLYPEGVLKLNETAHAIVLRCDGKTSVADLLRSLAEEYGAGEADLRDDVLECLEDLRQRRLLVFTP
jgi:pyrroloquinoline quinone biosynthesis protein D